MNEYLTIDNMSEVVEEGFESRQDAIDYVVAYPEKHMPSFFVKEVQEYELWGCFIKQLRGEKIMKLEKTPGNWCNGLIYRAKVNHYATDDEIVLEIRLRKLKKKSCSGCDKCNWLREGLGEICEDWPVEGVRDVEHGKLYTLDICNEWRNWETGIIEDWDFCLKKVKEEGDGK